MSDIYTSNGPDSQPPILLAALNLYDAGLSVIRATMDGQKKPWGAWKAYMVARATREEVWSWFASGEQTGIGVVCGAVSGHLECLDFDDRMTFDRFCDRAIACGLHSLLDRITSGYAEDTPNGRHLYYYVAWDDQKSMNSGSTKLAQRKRAADGTIKTLMETKGEGGFVIVAPSYGTVHPDGKPYVLQRGGPATIPTITEAERAELFVLARSFHELPIEPEHVVRSPPSAATGDRPGDLFAAKYSWEEILLDAGWHCIGSSGEQTFWRRPGKDHGISATTNYAGSDLFYCFSTSVAGIEERRGYDKFGFHTRVHFGGDFSAAAKVFLADEVIELQNVPRRESRQLPFVVEKEAEQPPTDEPHVAERTEQPQDPPSIPLLNTDLGNAGRLIHRHKEDLLWCQLWKKWLTWTGTHWQIDTSQQVTRWAVDTVRSMYAEAAEIEDAKQRAALVQWGIKSEARPRIEAIVALAQSGVPVQPDELDTHPWLLNCANGTVNLRTGLLEAHKPAHKMTKCLSVAYDPEADCVAWEAFLSDIFQGNEELINYVWRALGYSLTGLTTEQCFFLLFGSGQNGKSTFLNIMGQLLGDYQANTSPTTFLAREGEAIRNDIAALRGSRFVAASELEDGKRLSEAMIKQMTGGEPISARFLYAEWFDYMPEFKIWLATNHMPEIRGTDKAMWRRVKLIPFNWTVPEAQRDNDLPDKLMAELPGILAWCVRGCLEWIAEGLVAPDIVQGATNAYREEQDVLGAFIEDGCEKSATFSASASGLYVAYVEWCKEKNETPLKQTRFGRSLQERGFWRERSTVTKLIIRHGLKLRLMP